MKTRLPLVPALIGAVILLGMLLAYLGGRKMARIEHDFLLGQQLRVEPDEVDQFSILKVNGRGLFVRLTCGAEVEIEAEEHPDEIVYVKTADELTVGAQQVTSAEPFEVSIQVSQRLTQVSLFGGARVEIPPCAVHPGQFTVHIAGGAAAAISGSTDDFVAYVSSGSEVVAGSDGPLQAETARVDIQLGSTVDLCGAEAIRGWVSYYSRITAREDVPVDEIRPALVDRTSCAEVERTA